MTKLKAVLFDLDGVLRDSREVIFPALEYALEKHTGKIPSREEMIPHVHHEDAVHAAFASDTPKEAFVATYLAKIAELRPNTKLYKDAREVVELLTLSGYKLGIVSHATTGSIFLTDHGLADFFSVILGAKDLKERKPSPVPILQALEYLGVEPHEAIMVGDLPADIEAAVGARLRAAVGITHGFGDEKYLRDAGASPIINSLLELSAVIMRIEGSHGS